MTSAAAGGSASRACGSPPTRPGWSTARSGSPSPRPRRPAPCARSCSSTPAREGRMLRGARLEPPGAPALKAVVLDFGGPMLLTPFERLPALERSLGLPPGTFGWRGPFDPAADPLWRSMQAGELSERAYWASRAVEVAAVSGDDGMAAMMARLYDGPEDELVWPQARAAGLQTALLTNDLSPFQEQAWIGRIGVLAEIGCVVDTSRHGTRKPEPAAYRLVLDRLGVAADQAVLVDDQPANVAGAEAAGMAAVWFDVTRPGHSYQQVRQAIGLADDGGSP